MNVDELTRLFDTFEHSAFRLEQLQTYLVPQEADEFEAFKAGKPLPLATPATSPWLAKIASDTAAGKRWYRVRIVDHPLTDYTRHELRAYQSNAGAGEQINIVDRDTRPDLDRLREDFWLLDDRLVIRMRYDDEGHFLGADKADPSTLDLYRRNRDLVLDVAVPLHEYQVSA